MCCKKSKKYKNKLCFWRFDNLLFLATLVLCIIAWCCTYFIEWFEFDEMSVSFVSGILIAALVPLGLNYGKYIKEQIVFFSFKSPLRGYRDAVLRTLGSLCPTDTPSPKVPTASLLSCGH